MRVAAIAIAMLLLAPACGSDDEVTDIAGIPVLEGHTAGPGTELGDGFSVVEGSVLLGDVMPPRMQYGPDGPARGWRALLLVTGDAREVFTAYAQQASDTGLVLEHRIDGLCRVEDAALRCEALGGRAVGGSTSDVELSLDQGPARDDQPPRSHLFLGYQATGTPGPAAPVACDCATSGADVEVPRRWPPLPGEDEPFEPSTPQQAGMVVERGSEIVAHPGTPLGLRSAALFEVTGDPEEVLDRYEHQNEPYDQFADREQVDGGTRLHRFWGHGGGIYTADLLIRPGEPTYLLIEHSATD